MIIAPADKPDKPRRRLPHWGWFLLVAVILGIIGVGLHFGVPYSRQMAVIHRIESLDGKVLTEPSGPDWVREILGDGGMRGFDDIAFVTFRDGEFNDNDLAALGELNPTKLRKLRLQDSQVTSKGLTHLHRFSGLTTVTLPASIIQQEAIDILDRHSKLEMIVIVGPNFTQSQLEEWGKQLTPCKIAVSDH